MPKGGRYDDPHLTTRRVPDTVASDVYRSGQGTTGRCEGMTSQDSAALVWRCGPPALFLKRFE